MYESYYQEDKTENSINKNAQIKRKKLSNTKPRGIGRLAFSFGNKEIECEGIKLFWGGKGVINFYREGKKHDKYNIELAPTIWTDISQVNFFDQRITWYKYDDKRKRVNIPIDQLWENK